VDDSDHGADFRSRSVSLIGLEQSGRFAWLTPKSKKLTRHSKNIRGDA